MRAVGSIHQVLNGRIYAYEDMLISIFFWFGGRCAKLCWKSNGKYDSIVVCFVRFVASCMCQHFFVKIYRLSTYTAENKCYSAILLCHTHTHKLHFTTILFINIWCFFCYLTGVQFIYSVVSYFSNLLFRFCSLAVPVMCLFVFFFFLQTHFGCSIDSLEKRFLF